MSSSDTPDISHERVMAAFADLNRMIERRQCADDAHSERVTVDLGPQ